MTKQRKWYFLIGLAFVWALLILLEATDQPEQPNIPSNIHTKSLTQQPNSQVAQNIPTLAEYFDNPRKSIRFTKARNIFAPLTFGKPNRKKVEQKRPPTPPPHKRPSQTIASPKGPSPAELAAQRARQQLSQYRFLGYLTKGGESQAFLTNGHAIYIVKQGERVEGLIQVNSIEPTTVVLSIEVLETGDNIEATIPLTEKKPG